MEEIRVYSSIWRRELFIGVISIAAAIMLIITDATKLPVILFFGLIGLYALFDVFRERLMHRPYLTITDKSIIINRKWHNEITVRFNQIMTFERETLTMWKHTKYTGNIIVHLKNGHGFVHIISADSLATKELVLWDMLNERLKRQGNEKKEGTQN